MWTCFRIVINLFPIAAATGGGSPARAGTAHVFLMGHRLRSACDTQECSVVMSALLATWTWSAPIKAATIVASIVGIVTVTAEWSELAICPLIAWVPITSKAVVTEAICV